MKGGEKNTLIDNLEARGKKKKGERGENGRLFPQS